MLLAFMFDLLELPAEAPPLVGLGVLVLAGAGMAWVGGGLAASLIGAGGAVGLALLASAVVHHAFGQTPWRMYAIEFLPLLALTVAAVVAAIGIGWLAGSLLRRGAVRSTIHARGLLGALAVAVVVVGGGTVLAGATQAVIPSHAQEVRISIVDGSISIDPPTWSASASTYILMEADVELEYLPVTSDADAARRMTGDLVDREGLAGGIVPRDMANNLRRVQFQPGRYVLVAILPAEPFDESSVLILDPEDPPPDTPSMRTDIGPVEFVVTD